MEQELQNELKGLQKSKTVSAETMNKLEVDPIH